MPSTDRLREIIRGVYERKNPEKLADLDKFFEKYAGKEMTMYRFICNKYGEKPIRFVEASSHESPKPDPGNDSLSSESSQKVEMAKAEPPEIQEDFEAEALSRREQGNLLFKKGKLRKAIAAYKESVESGEEDWILALSNRAICHLKLKEYEEALSVANTCLEHEPATEVPWKVHLTKFKALAELHRWVKAFSTLRKLRAHADLPEDVMVAATQEERARRRQYAEWAVEEWSSSDEEEDADVENATFYGESAEVCRSLAGAIQLVVPRDLGVKKVSLVHVFGETVESFREAFASSSLLAPDCEISIVKRDAVCKEVDAVPELAVLCRPRLSSALELWLPVIKHLVERKVLTVVTGFTDQSLVQDEDVLEALGCTIVSPTACRFDSDDVDAAGGEGNTDCHPHHHALAFQGGHVLESVDLESLRKLFSDRGFDVDLSEPRD
jgi:tetratricopeptide (TPR) repeat protein